MIFAPALTAILAAAASDTLAIVDVESPDSMTGLSVQATRVLIEAAAALQLTTLSPEEVRGKLSDLDYASLVKCGGNPACVSHYAPRIGAKRIVLGSLSRNERHYLVKLWLIDVEQHTIVADVDRQVLIASRRLQKDLEQAVPGLLKGESEARGTLLVKTNVRNAQLTINGEPHGSTPFETQLKPGKYEIKLERRKFMPVTRLVNVEANEKNEVVLKLLLVPGETVDPDELTEAPTSQPTRVEEKAASAFKPTAGPFVAGALAFVALGVGCGFGGSSRALDARIAQGFDPISRTFDSTRADALTAARHALVATVAFGASAFAAIATSVLIVIDATRDAQMIALSPTLNGVSLSGRF